MATPPWVHIDHAGLVARIRPARRDFGWAGFMAALAVLWSLITIGGLISDGLDWNWLCIAVFNPLLWFLAVMMVWGLGTRTELRLAADGLSITTWRFGIASRRRFDLAQLMVEPVYTEGSKGTTHTWLRLTQTGEPATREAQFWLPGGTNLRERAGAKAELAWMTEQLNAATAIARRLPPPDPGAQDPELAGLLAQIGARRHPTRD